MHLGRHLIPCAGRIGLLAAGLIFAGCRTGERLLLDATSRPEREKVASYSLKVTDPEIEKDSLRHKEAERLVKAALAGRGYYESPDPAKADLVVTIDYGIGQGVETIYKAPEINIPAEPDRVYTVSVSAGTDAEGREIMQNITVSEPGFMGMKLGGSTIRELVYEKRLVLVARKAKAAVPGEAPADQWTVEVISTGPSHDLRKTLPVLAAVALEHIGDETDGRQAIKLTDEEAIAFVKNPANAP